jgi:hypothetical protein
VWAGAYPHISYAAVAAFQHVQPEHFRFGKAWVSVDPHSGKLTEAVCVHACIYLAIYLCVYRCHVYTQSVGVEPADHFDVNVFCPLKV